MHSIDRLQSVILVGISGIAIATATALAGEADIDVDNVVVTGTRTSNLIAEIPNTTTVIRLHEIQARNDMSIADLLRHIPGIHVTQPSGQGGVARVYVRGGDLEMTMVMLDGIRVNDPNDARGSAFDFSTVNINDVERIEIVRGPQSAVYGSNALAGVINIISKEPADEFSASVFAEAGTDDFYRGAFDVSGPVGSGGAFTLRIAGKNDGEAVSQTTFSSDTVTGKLAFGRDDKWDVRLFGSYVDSEGTAFPEDSGGAELAVIRAVDERSAEDLRLGVATSAALTDNWRMNALATWYDHDASFLSPGVAPGIRDAVPANGADSSLNRVDVAVNAVAGLGERTTITFGADYYDEDGRSDGFVEFGPGFVVLSGFEFDRSVAGGFAELHYKSDTGPTFLASIRRDDPNEEAGETTVKVGMIHVFNRSQTVLRANWGQGFSLPGFFALASPLVGNPGLRPETSESLDLGVTHGFADWRISAGVLLFHNEFTDLIDFDTTTFMMVNRDRLDVDGVEMQLDYAISENLRLMAQATYLDMDVANSSTPLRQRPDWRGGLSVRWSPSEKWLLNGSWLSVGETFDSSVPTGDRFLDGYNRVDFTATFSHTSNLQLLLSVDNLFDEDYDEAIGFPSPGTRARLGIRYLF